MKESLPSNRPFAPSILREEVVKQFDLDNDSPYMLLVADVLAKHRISMTTDDDQLFGIEKLNVPRSSIPAVTDVDYSTSIQIVHRETNPCYHALITRFQQLPGRPIIINTSWNVRGESIVCPPPRMLSEASWVRRWKRSS